MNPPDWKISNVKKNTPIIEQEQLVIVLWLVPSAKKFNIVENAEM